MGSLSTVEVHIRFLPSPPGQNLESVEFPKFPNAFQGKFNLQPIVNCMAEYGGGKIPPHPYILKKRLEWVIR